MLLSAAGALADQLHSQTQRSRAARAGERTTAPQWGSMRLGFRNNFVVTGSESRLSYLTDTAGGSSGSPICDDAWFAAALHRGWTTITGAPLTVWGKAISQENYGTPRGRSWRTSPPTTRTYEGRSKVARPLYRINAKQRVSYEWVSSIAVLTRWATLGAHLAQPKRLPTIG